MPYFRDIALNVSRGEGEWGKCIRGVIAAAPTDWYEDVVFRNTLAFLIRLYERDTDYDLLPTAIMQLEDGLLIERRGTGLLVEVICRPDSTVEITFFENGRITDHRFEEVSVHPISDENIDFLTLIKKCIDVENRCYSEVRQGASGENHP